MLVPAHTLIPGDTVFSEMDGARYYYTIKKVIINDSEGRPLFGIILDVLDMRGRIIRAYLTKTMMINIAKS